MTTAQNIIDRILRPMRDAAQDFFGDPEMLEYINEAIEDLSARQRLEVSQATVVSAGGGLPLPAVVLSTRWVVNPDGVEVAWMDPTTFKEYQENVPGLTEDFPIAAVWDETVWLHPAPPDGENWTVGYFGLPVALTSVGDTIPLSRVWEKKIVLYGRSRCYTRLGEESLAAGEMGLYESGLRSAERAYDRNLPGTITLAREPNVFDNDPDSIHQGG